MNVFFGFLDLSCMNVFCGFLDLSCMNTLNIQRSRDHGIGSYNDVRESYGLNRKTFQPILISSVNNIQY